jgi:multidrug resistance efflux pump
MIRKYGLPLAALGLLVFAVVQVVKAQQTPPKLQPPVTPARSPFGSGVAGAGLVEARTENISVGANLPGIVTEVLVRVEQKVYKGDPLFRLDDRNLKAELRVRRAAVAAAAAQLERLRKQPRPEELPALEAKVREARANLVYLQDQAQRARRLAGTMPGAMSREEVVQRGQAARVAAEQLARAEADLALSRAGAWAEDVKVSETALEQARAQVQQTEVEIERLEVRALVDGEVLQVNVRPGEPVGTQPGQALVVLGNIEQLHVRVDIDENDIPRFRPGAPAKAMLRGDPKQEYKLSFVRVEPYVIPKKSLTGDNTERVDTRVLQVIYALEGKGPRVYVGQQLDVYVEGALRTPG